jgi:coenzyme F420 hydrogenase subunit beta
MWQLNDKDNILTVSTKQTQTIGSVVKNGLCTGCGTCAGLCPQNAVEMVLDRHKGIYLPVINRNRCDGCGLCFEVCPGHSVDFNELNLDIFGKQPKDILLGNYINCYVGHATDRAIRYNAASGGLVTALLDFALKEGIVDGALVTKMKENSPLEPQPFLARTREDILSASKSKYCPVSANIALKEILKEEGRFAVVGLPCHIHGIRKAEMLNKKLKQRIPLHFGIFCCGHTDTFLATEFVLQKYGIAKEDVVRLDYRGEGWPGYMKIILKNGTRKLIPRNEYIIYHNFGFFSPTRCAVCYDGINDLSDISFGDAWLPEVADDTVGTSVVISRTTNGELFLQKALEKGIVSLAPIDRKKVRRMDSKKIACRMKLGLARLLGRKCPRYNTRLPWFGFSFPPPPLFFLCMALSGRRSWWIIQPFVSYLNFIVKLGKILLRR